MFIQSNNEITRYLLSEDSENLCLYEVKLSESTDEEPLISLKWKIESSEIAVNERINFGYFNGKVLVLADEIDIIKINIENNEK